MTKAKKHSGGWHRDERCHGGGYAHAHCPKCGNVVGATATACAACGAVFAQLAHNSGCVK